MIRILATQNTNYTSLWQRQQGFFSKSFHFKMIAIDHIKSHQRVRNQQRWQTLKTHKKEDNSNFQAAPAGLSPSDMTGGLCFLLFTSGGDSDKISCVQRCLPIILTIYQHNDNDTQNLRKIAINWSYSAAKIFVLKLG